MRLSSFLPTAALALTASAFLIPLEVADKAIASAATPSITTSKQTIKLDCPSCPVALENGKWRTESEGEIPDTHLVMDFAIQNNQLKLNGVPIFPPQNRPIIAKQELSHPEEGIKTFPGSIPLSTSIDVQPAMIRGRDGLMKLQVISFEVIGLMDKVVRIPTIKIRLAELSNGQYALFPIEQTPYHSDPAADACTTVICRVRTLMAAKFAALRAAAMSRFGALRNGCMRKLGLAPALPPVPTHRNPNFRLHGGAPKFTGRPQVHGGHRHHGFRMAIRRILRNVVVPTLFGISVGLFVGAIAVLVSRIFVAMFMHFRRGRNAAAYEQVEQEVEEGRASVDGPPKYEDVYTEPMEDVTDEKAELL